MNNTLPATNVSVNFAPHEAIYTITQVVLIGTIAAILSLLTVVGNIMVMISFKIDKQLQTISNYFLFSLAVADFAIGLISMPLFTISTLLGYWPLGPLICDTWLALDYLASNASVLNLLIISFDRYFSVTRPLTYRAKRTNKKAAFMIGSAWGISLLLWPPWIYSWPYIEGQRTVPDNECYIQFIETNHYITFGTAIAAFYVPVSVMIFLYWRIWRETEKRQKDLPNLQGGKKDTSRRSNSSDEATNVCSNIDMDELRVRPRSESSAADTDSQYMHVTSSGGISARFIQERGFRGSVRQLRAWCIAWWHSGKDESDTEEESPSEQGHSCITPLSMDTTLPSSVSRCTSLNVIRDPYSTRDSSGGLANMTPTRFTPRDTRSLPMANRLMTGTKSGSTDSVYTIVIKLPGGTMDSKEGGHRGSLEAPSIKMIPEDAVDEDAFRSNSNSISYSNHVNRRPSAMPDVRIPLNAKGIPKHLAGKALLANATKNHGKKKKKTQEKKADKKAAKTLSAILLTFIITWTPYNILVLLKPVTSTSARIPPQLWDFFYYLCYINSTINPMCYALCNASFRRTYLRILQCKWQSRNRAAAVNRGFYNN
ncbi:muscarinic acetylcholine receptor DM1 [Anthonomus grandis grandis]|uniref:muscarinic acetylcholine receptor DM1 n=1 Tax=Anthonomus grandis grandis TaxID=2921223 RepID=UPI002166BDD0|nr:muscarinic acetylcholine receptor DM1 [Anthonomus grandis grandis]